MAQLSFKQGKFKDINSLQVGDLGFAVLPDLNGQDTNYGTIVLKGENTLFKLMPTPGDANSLGLPLVSNGQFSSPTYSVLGIGGGGTGASSAGKARENLGFTGAITSVISNDLPTLKVLISDKDGKISSSEITPQNLNTLKNISSNIQDQIDSKASITIVTWGADDS